jgi:co-chaperonin GroES (HSP10)
MSKTMNLGVTIQPIEEKTEKIGMIIIPNSVEVKKKYKSGVVRGTGKGTEERPMEVMVGDKVMYKNNDYPLDENGFDVVHLDDILYVM